ncbi:uncharacterized protein ColSpa_11029 [Colletotrichum spaethianum]|uniref:Uncharacterized protein n=1 Tax=Colletotrichum spaethianum TaxID=700344 RepID=A0AA37PEQ9_9PEZI|nr:uncharacterized protein ColSpa_11029 [Colletotrichum spaethianum]GKT50848.1 hypothetical protein ColSpa_11029 [Colletotrichum spaethianum]
MPEQSPSGSEEGTSTHMSEQERKCVVLEFLLGPPNERWLTSWIQTNAQSPLSASIPAQTGRADQRTE